MRHLISSELPHALDLGSNELELHWRKHEEESSHFEFRTLNCPGRETVEVDYQPIAGHAPEATAPGTTPDE
jgi:hypothetical protein